MSDAIKVAVLSGVFSFMVAVVPKVIDAKSGIAKDVKEIKADILELKKDNKMNSDMIYQMLDHMATSNNSGQMKRALDQYNEYFRK